MIFTNRNKSDSVARADDHISKPLDLAVLARSLRRLLRPSSEGEPRTPIGLKEATACSPLLNKLAELDQEVPGLGHRIGVLFLDDTRSRVNELAQALHRGDADAVASIAHALSGSAANVGASEVAIASASLERMGRSGSLNEARATLDELRAAFDEASNLLAAGGMQVAA